MRFNRTNMVLLGLFVASWAVNWGIRHDPAAQDYEFAPQMAHSARYAAFAPNPNFSDRQTLRVPEMGTIARGLLPLHYDATPADAVRAGVELHNPVPSGDAAALARGAVVFRNSCQPCHGAEGRGDGLVAQRGFPPPPSLVAPHAVGLPDGQLFHILTYGQGNMASYASQISREDRWNVILHVRSLQQVGALPAGPAAAPAAASTGAPAEGATP